MTHEQITTTYRVDAYEINQLAFVQMRSTPHPQLLLVTDDHFYIFNHPYDQQPTQTIQQYSTTLNWADVDNDQQLDFLMGYKFGVAHYEIQETFPDVTAPTARAITPASGTDLVSRNAFVETSFNEALNETSITIDNAQLLVDGTPLAVKLSYDKETRVLRLTPQSLLPANQTITVWLGPGLQDLAGNGLDGNLNSVGGEVDDNYSWTFSTGGGIDESGPVVSNLTLSPNPVWAGMPILLSATVDDTNPNAASTVRQVEYFLDAPRTPGTGIPIQAVEGQLDDRQEKVAITIDTTGWSGEHQLYVQAEDSVGNWGTVTSVTLTLRPESRANWSTFGQNPAHTGYNHNQQTLSGYNYIFTWEQDLFDLFSESRPLKQVAVANGIVVANVNSEHGYGGIIAFDVNTGAELWRYKFTDKYSVNPATIAYGSVYFQQNNHGEDSYLFALNLLTGEEIWRSPFSAQWHTYYAPTVANGKVFINGGYNEELYAFDAFDGKQLWSVRVSPLSQNGEWAPTYNDGTVYSWVDGAFRAWGSKYGIGLWSIDVDWSWERLSTIANKTAYMASTGALVAIDLTTQTEKWRVTNKSFTSTPAVSDDEVYALNGNILGVYHRKTGQLLWSYDTGEALVGAPLVTKGGVYIASANHTWVLNRTTHQVIWDVDKGGWLTVANNQLFIAQSDGKLAVYNMPIPIEAIELELTANNNLMAQVTPANAVRPIHYRWLVSDDMGGVLFDSDASSRATAFELNADSSVLTATGMAEGIYSVELLASQEENSPLSKRLTVEADEQGQLSIVTQSIYLPFIAK